VAARATWKGFLKISLVNIPIKVFPATESAGTISFNQLHGECQTRIQQKRWCPHCEREVPNSEIVKGYEFEKGHYVVLTEEDIEKVRPESTRVIDLVQFADEASIDPMFVDRAYYLAPDGGVASEAFAVMRDGMAGKVGVGKLALYGREYLVAVKPQGRGIVMYTLHHAAEIRSIDQVDELNSVPTSVKPAEMKLAQQVISTFEGPLDPGELHRRIQGRAAADHRREDRRPGGGRTSAGSSGEGRQLDGRAPEESRHRQRVEEETRQGGLDRANRQGGGEAQASIVSVPKSELRSESDTAQQRCTRNGTRSQSSFIVISCHHRARRAAAAWRVD
jgi:DNA end-binding protein Ku